MGDEYVDRFEQLKKSAQLKKDRQDFRKAYKHHLKGYNEQGLPSPKDVDTITTYIRDVPGIKKVPENQGHYLSQAKVLMERDDPAMVLKGARLYEEFGYGNRASVKRRLLKGVERGLEKGKNIPYEDIQKFLERNSSERGNHSDLEKRTFLILSIIPIIASFFFLSSNVTGNAIAGMEIGTLNLIGGGLFILGLLLLFLVRKLLL